MIPGSDGITMDGHILLGNYANACLAEYAARGKRSANEIAAEFCRENAVDYIKANPNRSWLQECRNEAQNLKKIIDETLPREHKIANRDWQIEAPLYSPQFGLSARADAISYSSDRSSAVVVELKSGKWDAFQGDRPKAEHVCQPSFYADVLGFSNGIRRKDGAVMPFLYYAKTIPENPRYGDARKDGRLFLRPNVGGRAVGDLIRYFSSIRNHIMLIEAKARSGELRSVVDSITVESFRNEAWDENGMMWKSYKRPEIESLLSPFQKASELDKRYFYRLLQFVAEESFVSRVGDSGSEIGRGGLSMGWRLGVKKRQESGLRLSELERIVKDGDEDSLGRIVRLTFDVTRNRG